MNNELERAESESTTRTELRRARAHEPHGADFRVREPFIGRRLVGTSKRRPPGREKGHWWASRQGPLHAIFIELRTTPDTAKGSSR
jgi:hypothetical protein